MKWEKHLSLNTIRSSESPFNLAVIVSKSWFRHWSKFPMAVHNHISFFEKLWRISEKKMNPVPIEVQTIDLDVLQPGACLIDRHQRNEKVIRRG